MKLSYTEEISYLLKASLIEARNKRMRKVSVLAVDVHNYRDVSRLNWEINRLNELIDKCDRNTALLFVN